ncbi:BatD family protein [Ruegeria arenilitoris]|uniref:BatD family protein n=1 Tax=Ruegeria arenilitoris TaxID=1173585 RepID=UPI001480D930|nr:BatD family protein [Ruegeria arenilitoris]
MRYLAFLMFSLFPCAVFAQTSNSPQPQVTVQPPSEDVIVGQPAILRIKVLVPTFMPSPPIFPALEQENLLVRLPERASGPVSESVNGATWSGVQRSYRIYPLAPGAIEFDAQDMTVTFADPETNSPTQVSVSLPPIKINAVVPDGARDLSPLIIATGFELEQEVEGPTEMQAGDAVTRRLTARIWGTSPIMIPQLIQNNQDPLLRPYPKEARFTETEDRGILSGQRIDETVYLAQDGGETQLPPVSLQWFNLTTNAVETVDVEAVELKLAAPKPELPSAYTLIRYFVWVAATLVAVWTLMRWMTPRYRSWKAAREQAYRASPEFALAQLRRALHDQDLSAAYSALETWKRRCDDPQGYHGLEACLSKIGSTRYSADNTKKTPDWPGAISALNELVAAPKNRARSLPPLNP